MGLLGPFRENMGQRDAAPTRTGAHARRRHLDTVLPKMFTAKKWLNWPSMSVRARTATRASRRHRGTLKKGTRVCNRFVRYRARKQQRYRATSASTASTCPTAKIPEACSACRMGLEFMMGCSGVELCQLGQCSFLKEVPCNRAARTHTHSHAHAHTHAQPATRAMAWVMKTCFRT
jgi:hypothetical protein